MISAIFLKPIFSAADKPKPDNGFRVYLYKCTEVSDDDCQHLKKGEIFTACGYYLGDVKYAVYEMHGSWKDYKGTSSFNVEHFVEHIGTTKRGIIGFLTSPSMKGIGEVTAKRIYDKFGDETLKIMDEDIEQLLQVRGITRRKLRVIKDSYIQMRGAKELITTLAAYDIKSNIAMKLYERYKENALEIIKTHPYQLMENHGIGFLTCDRIAKAFSFDMHSPERIEAAIEYALICIESIGHCGATKNMLFETVRKPDILGKAFPEDLLKSSLEKMIMQKRIYFVKQYFFRAVTYQAEWDVAQKIVELSLQKKQNPRKIEKAILQWEEKNSLTLDPEQKKAVSEALTNGFTVITGGAGKGKTTITRAIVDIQKLLDKDTKTVLLSPTGRAAKVLSAATHAAASTIHSILHLRTGMKDEDSDIVLQSSLIIVDEVSMLDLWVSRSLLNAIQQGCRVVFVGDINQLPSVGCGAILRDIIASGIVPVVVLKKNYRQGEKGSLIVENGDKINEGNTNIVFDKSSFMLYDVSNFQTQQQFEQSAKIMIALYRQKILEYGKDEVIVLSPHHHADTASSVDHMNRYLQYYVNPHDMDAKEIVFRDQTFRLGDMVMQISNDDEIANGDIGVITAVFKADNTLEVTFIDGKMEYSGEKLEELELAYATSIHKSQGSQYQCVIMNLLIGHGIMLKRNLFYTGISRAKLEVHLISTMAAIKKAIETEDTNVRITLLSEKIIQLYKKQTEFITLSSDDKDPFAQNAS